MFNHQEWERGNSKLQGGAHHRFMPQHVIFFYSINMDSFDELSICDKSVKRLLEILSLENSLSIEENVYANLVRIFYSNIENSSSRKMQILAKVGGVPIEFDVKDLNWILGTEDEGLKIYASRKDKCLYLTIFFMSMRLRKFVGATTFPMIFATFPYVLNSYPTGLNTSQHSSAYNYF